MTIGCHALIGAGAVVTKDVPDFAIAAGVPAQVIGDVRSRPAKRERENPGGAGLPGTATMVKVGLIGYGYWGPNLARCFSEAPKAQLAAVHDRRPDALRKAGQRYPHARMIGSLEDFLRDPELDAVAIATPVRTHYALALAALRAGKHVLIEKPMACTSQEARRLVDEAERRGRVLMVDHTFVYTGAVRKVRELVAAGELGQIHYYDSTRVNLGLLQKDINVVWDLAVHDLSILDFVLGERPAAIAATAASHVPGSPETMAFITLFFGSGTLAHINVNWLAPVKVRQVADWRKPQDDRVR